MTISRIAAVIFLFVVASAAQEPSPRLSPAEQKIEFAKKAIEKNPKSFHVYNDLAFALARRARETSDINFYARAEEALQQSFNLSPDNIEGLRARVWILLGKHEFGQALQEAKVINKRMPDDVLTYGFLVDANVELGNYQDAENAAQWMLDIRPGNLPGLTRAAYLRELFGDIDGALELMDQAYRQTPPTEVEDLAWILTQMAHLQLTTGKVDIAEQLLRKALELFPGYHYALGNLAKVRAAQEKHSEAVDLLRQRYQGAPHAENLYELAEALERAGRLQEAKAAYAEFEQKARREIGIADNANRELTFFYSEHSGRPEEALRIAQIEVARRHDVYTLDAYAWALYINGNYSEARKQIESGLTVGIRDAKFLYHAGAIASKLNDRAAAERYLKQSLETNSLAECSASAREALRALAASPASIPLRP